MTSHQLARRLIKGPNVPVVINGWGSDEGFEFEVSGVSRKIKVSFSGSRDTKNVPRDKMGWQIPRECVQLITCESSPKSDAQIESRKSDREKAAKIKKENPALYQRLYFEIKPLTPSDFLK